MAVSRAHILQMPNKFVVCRILQLVVAVVILGLTIYGVIYVPFNGIILGLFTSLATIICSIYILTATYGAPAAYNYWAILSLDIFCLIFWIVSLGLLAQVASFILDNVRDVYCSYYSGYCTTSIDTALQTYGAIQAAAAGLAGLEFILYIVSLVLVSITIQRHRRAGGHARVLPGGVDEYPTTVGPTPAYNPAGVPTAGGMPEKYEMHPGAAAGQTYAQGPAVEHQQGQVPMQYNGGAETVYQATPQQGVGAQHYQPGVGPQ